MKVAIDTHRTRCLFIYAADPLSLLCTGSASDLRSNSSNEGRYSGLCASSFPAIAFKRLSSFLSSSRVCRRIRPHDHLSALIGPYTDDFCLTLGAIHFFDPHRPSIFASSSFTTSLYKVHHAGIVAFGIARHSTNKRALFRSPRIVMASR